MTCTYTDLPKLGFGFMRLPEIETDEGKRIDIEQSCEMADIFMDAGFTYFDTARGYHAGKAEAALGAAVVDRYPRESFQIASKLPAWASRGADHSRSMFDKSLRETKAGYFDFFLMHNMGEHRTKAFDEQGIWDFLFEKKREGIIRNLGLSFHDSAQALAQVLDTHSAVDFVQLQINYADWESGLIESRKCYEVARERDLPIIVMEPVKGGSLVNLPEAAAAVLREANPEASLASWALRFAASLPGVLTVLSGMSTPDQVRENVKTMANFKPLSDSERAVLNRARDILANTPSVPCTSCGYCVEGCPEGVHIPTAFYALNIWLLFNDMPMASNEYNWRTEGGRASSCIACGACEEVCPQHIHIIDELKRTAELFEK